jgi:GT2 family glycosyltransferase
MTVRQEEAHLASAVRSVLDNTFAPGIELVLAVGPSTDATEQIAADLAQDPRVTVIANPHGGTPQGLNLALAHARGDVVVRMDGHGVMPPGYIQRAVTVLSETGAANVGGRMVPDADAPFARAVAVAMQSSWGIGGAGHRVGGEAGPAESVFLGAFRKAALDDVGGYDEHFVRAQDWELNFRLRQAGYVIWFDPSMEVAYRPRASWRGLARQFYFSGQWRREVTRAHRIRPSVRYLAPPSTAIVVAVGLVLGAVGSVWGPSWLMLAFAAPLGYLAGVMGATASLGRAAGTHASMRLPGVLITMHLAWGVGFLRGVR